MVKFQSSLYLPTKIMAPKTFILLQTYIIFSSTLILHVSSAVDFNFPVAFNFGDSNSDTGGLIAGLGDELDPPNGQNFFQKPSGRFCDGRLIIDFLSNEMIISSLSLLN